MEREPCSLELEVLQKPLPKYYKKFNLKLFTFFGHQLGVKVLSRQSQAGSGIGLLVVKSELDLFLDTGAGVRE